MSEGRYTLAELVERAGVPARTIRFYTTEGLLPPPGTRGRYASYSDTHLDRLRLITRFKEQYLPLSAIRERLGSLSDPEIASLAGTDTTAKAPPAIQVVPVTSQPRPTAPVRQPSIIAEEPATSQVALRKPSPMAAPTPPQDVEGWRRVSLAPGIELHARAGLGDEMERKLGRLVSDARAFLQDQPQSPSRHRHAHPRAFALARHIDRGWGEIAFDYWWEASDGSSPNERGELPSLAHCQMYEVTTYAGNEGEYAHGWYLPPDPPFVAWRFRDPTDGRTAEVGMECFVASHGRAWDRHKIAGRLVIPEEPRVYTCTAIQTYMFHCEECGADEVVPGPRGGPHPIVRTFGPSPTGERGVWRYTITKHGFSAWMDVDANGFVTDSIGMDFGPW